MLQARLFILSAGLANLTGSALSVQSADRPEGTASNLPMTLWLRTIISVPQAADCGREPKINQPLI